MSKCPSSHFTYNCASVSLDLSLGPRASTTVIFVHLWRTCQWRGPCRGDGGGGCRLQWGISPGISVDRMPRGGSLWLERHLWLHLDSNLSNAMRGSQEENYFMFTGKTQGHKCAGCWEQGNAHPLFSLVSVSVLLLICLHADWLCQLLMSGAGNLGTDCS